MGKQAAEKKTRKAGKQATGSNNYAYAVVERHTIVTATRTSGNEIGVRICLQGRSPDDPKRLYAAYVDFHEEGTLCPGPLCFSGEKNVTVYIVLHESKLPTVLHSLQQNLYVSFLAPYPILRPRTAKSKVESVSLSSMT